MATLTPDATGRFIVTQGPPLHIPPTQHVTGSFIDAASSKTLASQAQQVAAYKSLGAGTRGGKRRTKRGGAVNMNAQVPYLPEAGTIQGVSHETNHLTAVNNLNQIRADASYDSQIHGPAYQVAGKRRKTVRKSNGRRHKRSHRGHGRKSAHHRRGRRSSRK